MCKKILLLALWAFAPYVLFANGLPNIASINLAYSTTSLDCDLAAPTSLNVVAVGLDWATLTFVPSVAGVDHRVKTFRTSDGMLISNIVVSAATTPTVTINGLVAGETYFSTVCAICPDGVDSQNFASSPDWDTIIAELIVLGVTESEGNSTCGIRLPGEYCGYYVDGTTNIFKIRKVLTQETIRQFNIRKETLESGEKVHRVIISTNAHRCVFRINGQMDPNEYDKNGVRGKTFTVHLKASLIAQFELTEYDGLLDAGRITWKTGETGYEILRITEGPYGLSGPTGGQKTEFIDTGNEVQERNVEDLDLSSIILSPNPFTDYLDVYLPENAAEQISLQLFNLSGQKVLDQQYHNGQDQLSLSTTGLSPGFYLLRIQVDGAVQTIKVVKSE